MSRRIRGLTIEINGDTTKLTKALGSVDSALSRTQSNLRDLNKALELDPSNTALLKDRQQELANAIKNTEEKLKIEKDAYDQLAQADKTPENVERMRQLKEQIDLDSVALKELKKQARDAASVLGSKMQEAGKKISEVGDKIKGVGDKIAGFGSTLTRHVTVPIATAFGTAVKITADFDEQMSKVQAISGASAEEMDTLRDVAREMGAKTKFSATEAGQGYEYMAMAGWKASQMISGLPAILNLAAASGEDLGTTSDIVTDALTAFGLSAEDSTRFANVLAAASSNSNTNVSMMGETFKYVAPVAGALGYSIEDVALASGLMANSGIKATMAGTSLRNIMQRMAKPTKESSEAMETLGVSLYDDEGKMYSFRDIMDQLRSSMSNIKIPLDEYNASLDELDTQLENGDVTQKEYDSALEELNLRTFGAENAEKARAAAMLGGARAMAGLLAITEASDEDYNNLANSIDNSSQSMAKLEDGSIVPLNQALADGQTAVEQYDGAAATMAATMQDNLNGQVTTLKSQLQELAISFGDLLMPIVSELTTKIQGLVDKFNSLDEGQKKIILKVAGVIAVLGPVIIIIGKIVGAIGTIISVVGTVTTAIGAAMPVITLIATTITGTVLPAIASVIVPLLPIIAVIAAIIAIVILCVKHWDEIKAAVLNAVEAISAKWQEFKEWFAQKWEEIKTNASNAVQNMKNAVVEKITSLVLSAVTKFLTMKTKIENTIENLKNGVRDKIDKVKTTITEGIQKAVDFIKGLPSQALEWGRDFIMSFVNGIKEKISSVKDTFSGVADTIKGYIHFSEPDVGPLSDFHTYAPDMMRLFADGIKANAGLITDALSSSFDLRPYFASMNKGISDLGTIGANLANSSANSNIVLQVSLEGDAKRMFNVMSDEAHRVWQTTGQSKLMGY